MISYIETLRVRNSLALYGIIVTALILGIVLLVGASTHGLKEHISVQGHGDIPLSGLAQICGYCMAVFATVVGTSVCNERNRVLAWTRPMPREKIVLSYALVDVTAIVAAFVLAAVVVAFLPLAIFGLLPLVRVDQGAGAAVALFFGISLMWYGVLQAITAWARLPGGAVAGISWGAFITLVLLAQFDLPPAIHAAVLAIDIFNPLAYVSSVTFTVNADGSYLHSHALFGLEMGWRTLAVYAIAVLAEFVAILGWKRAEL